jgi:hypothetical protein
MQSVGIAVYSVVCLFWLMICYQRTGCRGLPQYFHITFFLQHCFCFVLVPTYNRHMCCWACTLINTNWIELNWIELLWYFIRTVSVVWLKYKISRVSTVLRLTRCSCSGKTPKTQGCVIWPAIQPVSSSLGAEAVREMKMMITAT